MKELIDEIEKLKNRGGWTNDEFYRCGINDCVNLLNQYNIINTPKQIKLSEIMERLRDSVNTSINIERYKNKTISIFSDFCLVLSVSKYIEYLNHQFLYVFQQHKWLYTLWIAGTIIEDDLEELK